MFEKKEFSLADFHKNRQIGQIFFPPIYLPLEYINKKKKIFLLTIDLIFEDLLPFSY